MSKGMSPQKLLLVSLGTYAFLFLLAFVAIKISIDDLKSQKSKKEDLINVLANDKTNFIARIQSAESEERITTIAHDELGMIKNDKAIYVLEVPVTEMNSRRNFK